MEIDGLDFMLKYLLKELNKFWANLYDVEIITIFNELIKLQ
ncbi:MAG: hypothetical protein ACTSRP_01205 [Candidatus Helarchaeota archaeon]